MICTLNKPANLFVLTWETRIMCYTSIEKFYIVHVQYVVNQLQKNDNKPKNMDTKNYSYVCL